MSAVAMYCFYVLATFFFPHITFHMDLIKGPKKRKKHKTVVKRCVYDNRKNKQLEKA